jgi:hypothetical protein
MDTPLTIENSTIANNQASGLYGGGLRIYYTRPYNNSTTIRNTTIAGNSANGGGGGVWLDNGIVSIENSIVADNSAEFGSDISNPGSVEGLGAKFNLRYSLVENAQQAAVIDNGGNIFDTDPQLGPLQDNGGPTQTQRPAATSPAIDAGDPAFTPPPATDQRGGARVSGAALDMGAVEFAPGTVTLSVTSVNVSEAGVSATLTVTRSGGSDGAASVGYATADGTATAGQDYGATSGTLSWPDRDATDRTITVPISDDTAVEGDETFTLALSNVQGALLGRASSALVTNVDNDTGSPGNLSLNVDSVTVNEGAGTATLSVSRAGGSAGAVSVVYATAGGTATAGQDFTATSGTLSWPDGDVSARTITIPISDDTLSEGDETLTLSLSNPQGGAQLGAISLATITIVDNDFKVFLPDIVHTVQPDLVVSSIALTPEKTSFAAGEPVEMAVTITNQGTASAGPFWVDLYLDPASEPGVNQRWNVLCKLTPCYGLAWGVTTPLAPGQSIVLRSTIDSYAAGQTIWPGAFAAGTTRIVVLADSYNSGNPLGAVAEQNEANNSASLNVTVTGENAAGSTLTGAAPELGERPDIPQREHGKRQGTKDQHGEGRGSR